MGYLYRICCRKAKIINLPQSYHYNIIIIVEKEIMFTFQFPLPTENQAKFIFKNVRCSLHGFTNDVLPCSGCNNNNDADIHSYGINCGISSFCVLAVGTIIILLHVLG